MEIKVTSQEVLDIIEKYREKLGIRTYLINVSDYDKEFSVIFKNKQDKEMYLKVDFKNNRFSFQKYYSDWTDFYFEDISTFRILVDFIEELNKIEFMKLKEFTEYAQKQKEKEIKAAEIRKLEQEQEKLAEQIRKMRIGM